MPIWGEVELLCRAVLEEGRKEADKILTQAKAESETIIASAQARAEKDLQEQILAQRNEATLKAKRLVDSAELEARKRIIAFRERVIQEIFSALELSLKNLRHQPEYPALLLSTVKEAVDALPGKEFVVELKQEDVELVKEQIEALGRERSVKIEVRTSPYLEGGSRVYGGDRDRRVLYDNSLSARLRRREDDIRRKIWSVIFGTERSER